MLTLREVKHILREYDLRPSKRLGQNFLIDANIQKKMIKALDLTPEDNVLEIGPGLGALTDDLCATAKKVTAVEKDYRLWEFLSKKNERHDLELIRGDILKYDFNRDEKLKAVGNLPYYISSLILIMLLKNRHRIGSIYITVQREFAERIVAGPGSKVYGSISCFTQFYAEPKILFPIKKNAFYPAPKVDSCFLSVTPRDKGLYLTDEEKLFKIIRNCFEKRRKTILSSLRSSGLFGSKEEVSVALDKSGILPERRPETVSLKEFVDLNNILDIVQG